LLLEESDGFVKHVQVNGVDLEYVDEGAGVPVVLSHQEPDLFNNVVLDFLSRH